MGFHKGDDLMKKWLKEYWAPMAIVFLFIFSLIMLMKEFNKITNEVHKRGLKNIIEEIWEGGKK